MYHNLAFCQQTIVVLGDSFSASYGMKESEGWVTLLKKRLTSNGYDFTLINESISGFTTQNGLDSLPTILKEHQPNLLILSLGGNDGLRGMPIPHIKSNLKSMLQLCQNQEVAVLLIGVELPVNYGEFYREQFRAIYVALADEFETPLIPFLLSGIALELNYFQEDRIHPNAQAQPYMLDQLWPILEPLLSTH